MSAYATVDEYRTDTADTTTDSGRISSMLVQQSAKLRALAGISSKTKLTEDERALARALVTDAARKALVPSLVEGMGEVSGATQASFSVNGFMGTASFANPSGSAYFDRSTLAAFKRLVKGSQTIGTIMPGASHDR